MAQEDTIQFLKQFPVFKDLTDEEMIPIVEFSYTKKWSQGEMIFMQDEPITDVYFIKSGAIKVYRTDYNGKEQIVNVLNKNDMFPHQGLFRKGNYPAHTEVAEHGTTLIRIPIESFEIFLINHPEICIKMFRVLGDIIVDLQDRLEQKMLYNVTDQIIMLLLRLADKYGIESGRKMKLSMVFTNRELANMIGSSRETVSRTLSQLKKKELVNQDAAGHIIVDYDGLEDEVFQ